VSARVCCHGKPAGECGAAACRIEHLAIELHNMTESRALYMAAVEASDELIEAALAIHFRTPEGHCGDCCHGGSRVPYPCPTARALGVETVSREDPTA
jgi:hypothetical protein